MTDALFAKRGKLATGIAGIDIKRCLLSTRQRRVDSVHYTDCTEGTAVTHIFSRSGET